jgi:Tfp pilus assembly protein PilF
VAARLNLGLARYRQQRFLEAVAEWETCLVHDPSNAQAKAYLAMLGSKGSHGSRV